MTKWLDRALFVTLVIWLVSIAVMDTHEITRGIDDVVLALLCYERGRLIEARWAANEVGKVRRIRDGQGDGDGE